MSIAMRFDELAGENMATASRKDQSHLATEGRRKAEIGSVDARPTGSANDNTVEIRRNSDGTIDTAFYRARAHWYRRQAVGELAEWLGGLALGWLKPRR